MAEEPIHEIDWGSATIKDATLSVELTGSAPKQWRESFDAVLAPDLRHFLESIVQQVNSDLEPEEDEAEQVPDDPRKAADQELAATFREFAEE